MNDRIRLAEAMGWTINEAMKVKPDFAPAYTRRGYMVTPKGDLRYNFDPFTDANDDYAVLEWMRENWQGKEGHYGHWHQTALSLWWRWDEYAVVVPYQIGDYARAALKVIDGG